MQPSSARQKVCLVFFIASMAASVVYSYVWAYHLAPPDSKFPTHWAVFKLSFSIFALVASISTLLFAVPLCFVRELTGPSASFRDYFLAVAIAFIIHTVIFASPQFSRQYNPFLLFVIVAPILGSVAFLASRHSKSLDSPHDDTP